MCVLCRVHSSMTCMSWWYVVRWRASLRRMRWRGLPASWLRNWPKTTLPQALCGTTLCRYMYAKQRHNQIYSQLYWLITVHRMISFTSLRMLLSEGLLSTAQKVFCAVEETEKSWVWYRLSYVECIPILITKQWILAAMVWQVDYTSCLVFTLTLRILRYRSSCMGSDNVVCEKVPMGGATYILTKQEQCALIYVFSHSSKKEHPCLWFVLVHRWLASATLHPTSVVCCCISWSMVSKAQ